MKTFLKIVLGAAMLAGSATNILADDDKKAKEILSELSKNTKSYSTISAEYSLVITNKDNKQIENQKGKVKLKGKKYRLEIPENLIVTDGKTTWSKNYSSGECSIKDFEESSDLNPSNIFVMYEKGFKYKLEKTTKASGKNSDYVIILYPEKAAKSDSIKLFVDASKKKIKKMKIFKKNKNVETFEITSFVPNAKIEDSQFVFDTSKEKDCVDEREGH